MTLYNRNCEVTDKTTPNKIMKDSMHTSVRFNKKLTGLGCTQRPNRGPLLPAPLKKYPCTFI